MLGDAVVDLGDLALVELGRVGGVSDPLLPMGLLPQVLREPALGGGLLVVVERRVHLGGQLVELGPGLGGLGHDSTGGAELAAGQRDVVAPEGVGGFLDQPPGPSLVAEELVVELLPGVVPLLADLLDAGLTLGQGHLAVARGNDHALGLESGSLGL